MTKALALVSASHPLPCLAVSLFAGLFSFTLGNPMDRSAVVFFAMLFQQISVGLSNDWLDHKRDKAAGRKDKPTVSGLVRVSELRIGSLSAAALALLVSISLGRGATILMVVMLIAGWAYNLGMKSNWSSVIPYAVGFGSIPLFVGMASPSMFWVPAWVVLVAALLGVSAHFANVLPDREADKLTGMNPLPHILGQRTSALVIAFTALIAILILISQSKNLNGIAAAVGFTVNIVLVGSASLLSLPKNPLKLAFTLLILASLVNVVLLMIAGGF